MFNCISSSIEISINNCTDWMLIKMDKWATDLLDSGCTSTCLGRCARCKEHTSGVILKGSAIVGGVIGCSLCLIGQLFTGFDLETFCLMTGGCSFMGFVCGSAVCVKAGLVNVNHEALKGEIEKGENEKYYRTQRENNHRIAMHLYEGQMSNYRCHPSSSNFPTRPSY